mgnify:CR=1 FL=1
MEEEGEVGEKVDGENWPEEEEIGERRSMVGGADLTELGVFSLAWKLSDSLSLILLNEFVEEEEPLIPINEEEDLLMIC